MPFVNPIFGCQNYFHIGGVWTNDPIGNPPEPNNPPESVGDWLTYQKWIPSLTTLAGFEFNRFTSTNFDYFAMAGHRTVNGLVSLQIFDTVSWVNCFTPTFASDAVFFKTFGPFNAPTGRFRVQITGVGSSVPIHVGVMAVGLRHEVPFPINVPFTPPRFGKTDKILTARSVDGEYLGKTLLHRGIKFNVGFDLMPPDYVTSTGSFLANGFAATLDHLNDGLPCFFSWNHANRPADAAFCALQPGSMANPFYSHPLQQRVDLSMEGIANESFDGVT